MAVEFRKDGITAFIKVDGRLSHGPNLEDFRARWTSALASGCTQIIVDLSNVPTIDSSGMGNLVRCKAALDKEGGGMKIVGARAAMFEFYPDENTAAASFSAGK